MPQRPPHLLSRAACESKKWRERRGNGVPKVGDAPGDAVADSPVMQADISVA